MIRRKPLRARPAQARPADREARLQDRAARALSLGVSGVRASSQRVSGMRPAPKDPPALRSEAYRRAVASLPCAFCGIPGFSQHAHENAGKAKGMKVDDRRAMPLCCARPGVEGCHAAFDQYRLVPGGRDAHIELGWKMAGRTRERIKALGLWPKGVPDVTAETGH